MKPLQFTFVVLASVLFVSATASCDTEEMGPAQTRSTREESPPQTMPSAAGGGMMGQLHASCPMAVRGTDVTVTDTEGGVALTFTTDGDDVADLRTRVQQMAQAYEMHHGQRDMMWHHIDNEGLGHGGPHMGGEGMGHGGPRMGGEGMGHGGPRMGGEGMDHMTGHDPMPEASATMTNTDSGAQLELRPSDPAQLDALREHVRSHRERMHSGECWMLQGEQE